MKYLNALIKFHLVRIYNTFMLYVVGRTHDKKGKYLLLDNEENARIIGWKPEIWDYVDGKMVKRI